DNDGHYRQKKRGKDREERQVEETGKGPGREAGRRNGGEELREGPGGGTGERSWERNGGRGTGEKNWGKELGKSRYALCCCGMPERA
ncbi:MAG: hypothetical protein ACI3Y4_03375, partial [Candidatus Cryptobacteroides sp.]